MLGEILRLVQSERSIVSRDQLSTNHSSPAVAGVDPDVAPLVLPGLHGHQHQVEPRVADLRRLLEAEAHEGRGQSLRQDALARRGQVLLLPPGK